MAMFMFPILVLDSSSDWDIISAVLLFRSLNVEVKPHIASLKLDKRIKILEEIINFIESGGGYAIYLYANLRQLVKFYKKKHSKQKAWSIAMREQLSRIKLHLDSKGFSYSAIYADTEFSFFENDLKTVFKTMKIYFGKTKYIIYADAIAYLNYKFPKLVRGKKNIKEFQ